MLKLKLTKAEHTALPAHFQAEYVAEGDTYTLDTDVAFEDVSALKNALKTEKEHRRTATTKVAELEGQHATTAAELETLKARALQPSDLEKSWQAKFDKAQLDARTRQEQLTGHLQKLLVDNVATGMAGEISTAPTLLLPHIKSRLQVAEEDGQYITRVLDAEGKASALSVNELKAEFLASKDFAAIIRASQASGGGASGGKAKPNPGGKAFKDMSEAEKTALWKSDPVAYRAARNTA